MDGSELKHYGILGMKWGVRKNPDKAYSKASNKLRKLDAKITKKNTTTAKKLDKYEKAQYKADNAAYKADAAWTMWSRNRNARKTAKLNSKALKAKVQYNKSIIKSEKASKKAQNWYKQMNKVFSETSLSNVNQADIDLGREYAAIILEANRKGGSRTKWD